MTLPSGPGMPHVGRPVEGHQMVLARGVHRDIPDDDHLGVVDVEGRRQDLGGVGVEPGEEPENERATRAGVSVSPSRSGSPRRRAAAHGSRAGRAPHRRPRGQCPGPEIVSSPEADSGVAEPPGRSMRWVGSTLTGAALSVGSQLGHLARGGCPTTGGVHRLGARGLGAIRGAPVGGGSCGPPWPLDAARSAGVSTGGTELTVRPSALSQTGRSALLRTGSKMAAS